MPQRLSYSTLMLLNSCERKFQLERLLVNDRPREESEHLSFGSGFGAGIAKYLETQNKEESLFAAWLAYYPQIETDKKNQVRMVIALQKAFIVLDSLLQDYELVFFEGKPACELSFRLDIDADFYYVGYVDAVLKNVWTGKYVVFEVKTTGLLLKDLTPAYKHSGQALGYSIILDRIVGASQSSYDVLYFVAQTGKEQTDITLHVLPFPKTLLDRLNWFITLGLDVKHLHEMEDLQIYPRRGSACLAYNRPCKHFGTCHLHSLDKLKPEEEDPVEYQFTYDLEEIMQEHLLRIQNQPQLLQDLATDGLDTLVSEDEVNAGTGSASNLIGSNDIDSSDYVPYPSDLTDPLTSLLESF